MARLRYRNRKPESGESEAAAPLDPEQARRRTFQRAIKLISAKSRSVTELREILLQGQGATKTAVEDVIARLREYGYLDDERFAVGYASLKLRQRPLGRQRLRRELVMKKVDKAVVDEALDVVFAEVSETELIDRAIEKRTRIRGRPSNRTQAKSLFDHLIRQGFPFELVSEKVRAASRADLDFEETG